MRRGTYYLGRIIKLGYLDQAKLLNAIRESATVLVGKFKWMITNTCEGNVNGSPYIMGRLSKYAQEGKVTVVDEEEHLERDALASKLLEASSPFIYMPEFSGIAYLHVWNSIQDELFRKRFKAVIQEKFENFFVDCTIEPISDYKSFAVRLSKMRRITHITAKVHPPNPLFGRCWASLNEYIKKRNADTVSVREDSDSGQGLQSDVLRLLRAIMDTPAYEPADVPDIADAALLMAADGYGHGRVVGTDSEDVEIAIRTSDTQKNFLFDKEPIPEELAAKVLGLLSAVTHERNMQHGDVH